MSSALSTSGTRGAIVRVVLAIELAVRAHVRHQHTRYVLLRACQCLLFDEHALSFVAFPRAAEANDDRPDSRVPSRSAGERDIATAEEYKVVEVGAAQAKRSVHLETKKPALPEFLATLGTRRIAQDPEHNDLISRLSAHRSPTGPDRFDGGLTIGFTRGASRSHRAPSGASRGHGAPRASRPCGRLRRCAPRSLDPRSRRGLGAATPTKEDLRWPGNKRPSYRDVLFLLDGGVQIRLLGRRSWARSFCLPAFASATDTSSRRASLTARESRKTSATSGSSRTTLVPCWYLS